MNTPEAPISQVRFQSRAIVQTALQLLALSLLLGFCFTILGPFINPILWAAILAVALYPWHQRVTRIVKGRGTLAAVILIAGMLCILILPSVWLAIKTAAEIKDVVAAYSAGDIAIPPPPEYVKQWPLIGDKVDEVWRQASSGLDSLIKNNPEEVKSMAGISISLLKSSGQGLVLFGLAIILSGVFLSYSLQASNFATAFFNRLLNSSKLDITSSTAITIRGVVKGVLGVAFLQSILVAIGLLLADIPYAGVWALISLVLAVIQVGILPVCLGVIIYVWTTDHTTTAVMLTIWLVAVGFADNILKPILMGKGASVPMPVLLVGSLGGFLAMGFIGLFTGAVVLSFGYKLFDIWLRGTEL